MTDLNALAIFVKVAEAESFSEAARRLSTPVSTVSRKVAELEDQLGVRLLERSTRQQRLTDIGAEVLEHAQRGLEEFEAVDFLVTNQLAELKGQLQLSAPPSISDGLLAPIITSFQSAYPKVHVNVLVTDRLVDLISEGIDIAFRVGPLKDSSLIARTVLSYRHLLVASPDYLKRNSSPKKPTDLANHSLLAFSYLGQMPSWTFVSGGKTETITLQPHLAMNDYTGLIPALLEGSGIGDLPPIISPVHFKEGRLVEVMRKWRFAKRDLAAVHLGTRQVSRIVRIFKEFAVQMAPTLFEDLPR